MPTSHRDSRNRPAHNPPTTRTPTFVTSPHSCPIRSIEEYLTTYVALPPHTPFVIAAWTIAAWLSEHWDQFPYLAITSPEKRCGKTTLLKIIYQIVPRPCWGNYISPAALFRIIEQDRPTILLDESQYLSRKGSESSHVIGEILHAGIDKDTTVPRCVGPTNNIKIHRFKIYSPKIIAMIGQPDDVLLDRCLPVPMRRRSEKDTVVAQLFKRELVIIGKALTNLITTFTKNNAKECVDAYHSSPYLTLRSDRLADLLLPIQAVVNVICPERMDELIHYAEIVEARNRLSHNIEPPLRLLRCIKQIFDSLDKSTPRLQFIGTQKLISLLVAMEEEPWATYNRGNPINAHTLAKLLKNYEITSERNVTQTERGYYVARFREAFERYVDTD